MNRRKFLSIGAVFSLSINPRFTFADSFSLKSAKSIYLKRLKTIKELGQLPIIDVESSYNPLKIDFPSFTKSMDEAGVALMCLSVDQPIPLVKEGHIWSNHAIEAFKNYPSHFIPTANGGNHPAWTLDKFRSQFLDLMKKNVIANNYPLMGEFEVRHYPSPRQVKRGATFRDVDIPINGKDMNEVFRFSEETGIPFQLHYEIEDRLIAPLDEMLGKFPGAKVIWCHLAQIRYQSRSTIYSPKFLREWLSRHKNLFVDIAFGDSTSTYPVSGERHARFWENTSGWAELIEDMPDRFLAALDIGGDRMHEVWGKTSTLRQVIGHFSKPTQDWVAYKSAWKLLFKEEISV